MDKIILTITVYYRTYYNAKIMAHILLDKYANYDHHNKVFI